MSFSLSLSRVVSLSLSLSLSRCLSLSLSNQVADHLGLSSFLPRNSHSLNDPRPRPARTDNDHRCGSLPMTTTSKDRHHTTCSKAPTPSSNSHHKPFANAAFPQERVRACCMNVSLSLSLSLSRVVSLSLSLSLSRVVSLFPYPTKLLSIFFFTWIARSRRLLVMKAVKPMLAQKVRIHQGWYSWRNAVLWRIAVLAKRRAEEILTAHSCSLHQKYLCPFDPLWWRSFVFHH